MIHENHERHENDNRKDRIVDFFVSCVVLVSLLEIILSGSDNETKKT